LPLDAEPPCIGLAHPRAIPALSLESRREGEALKTALPCFVQRSQQGIAKITWNVFELRYFISQFGEFLLLVVRGVVPLDAGAKSKQTLFMG
jgi:hypothetical protein